MSNLGRVKSLARKIIEKNTGKTYMLNGRIMKDRNMSNGYIQACLRKDGKYHYKYVHRLVAISFIDNPNNFKVINHINCNKKDNRVQNLEWTTYKNNSIHASKNLLIKHGEKHHQTFLSNSQVLEIKRLIKNGKTNRQIADKFDISIKLVYDIKVGYTWSWLKED